MFVSASNSEFPDAGLAFEFPFAIGGRGTSARLFQTESFREEAGGGRTLGPCDLFGGALGHDPSAAGTSFRPKVDHPIGRLDHVQIVFHDDDCVSLIDEPVQDL